MRFRSTVLEPDGATVHVDLEAQSEQVLHERLHREGRLLVRVRSLDQPQRRRAPAQVHLPLRRLLLLTQALQEALDAGVPLLSTFVAAGEQEADPQVAAMLTDLADRVQAGAALSDALAAWPRAFPPLYCALVKAGEQSGSLPEVLQSMATFLEWRLEIGATVRQAMVYPVVVATAGYAMVLFLLAFVVPRLGSVLTKIGGELPPASRMLIGSSAFVERHVLAIVVGSLAAALGVWLLVRTAGCRERLARIATRLPVVRGIVGSVSCAQFCRTFSVLLQAGLTMTHALELAAAAVVSPRLREGVLAVRGRILGGNRLGEAFAEARLLPPVALSMVKVGEEAGRLPATFERLGRLYDREVRDVVKRALGLLEPIVTVVLGIVVGGVAVLVIGTIYSAPKGIGR
jgi:type IV pilus assembly protein PilC